MPQTIVGQIHEVALQAGLGTQTAGRFALRISNLARAKAIAARGLPAEVVMAILRDPRAKSEAALVQAFNDAAQFRDIVRACGDDKRTDLGLRNSLYFEDHPDGERVMPLQAARERLINALTDMDQHIDTARPSGARALDEVTAAAVYAGREVQAKRVRSKREGDAR